MLDKKLRNLFSILGSFSNFLNHGKYNIVTTVSNTIVWKIFLNDIIKKEKKVRRVLYVSKNLIIFLPVKNPSYILFIFQNRNKIMHLTSASVLWWRHFLWYFRKELLILTVWIKIRSFFFLLLFYAYYFMRVFFPTLNNSSCFLLLRLLCG